MFSLIISIIAIALVAALALASIYYGGSAFQEGSADAEASTVINQGQQIQGAVTLADVDEFAFTTPADAGAELVSGNYMKEEPSVRGDAWTIDITDGYSEVNVVNMEVCRKIEESFDNDTTVPAARETQAFGCFGTDDASATAYYKL